MHPFSGGEIILILLIVIIVFGPSKLPQLGSGLGQGIKNFKDALKEGKDAAKTEVPTSSESNKPQA